VESWEAESGSVASTVYSSAVGGVLHEDTNFDARTVHWMMGGPSHFSDAVTAAFSDGFDTAVQIATKPLFIFADVTKVAEAGSRAVRQLQAVEPEALAAVRTMRRREVGSRGAAPPASPGLDDSWWTDVCERAGSAQAASLASRLLQPLASGKPFDVVYALAEPLARALDLDHGETNHWIASSVLALLHDAGLRLRVTAAVKHSPGAGPVGDTLSPEKSAAIAAIRAMLVMASDFAVFQPLVTVQRVDGRIRQLVIER
jgi:hypothetical protein